MKIINNIIYFKEDEVRMIDPLDEKIASIRRSIAKFKKDHPELYQSEILKEIEREKQSEQRRRSFNSRS
jgi:hypothetical protein